MKTNLINRRKFIGSTGAIAAGTILASAIPANLFAQNNSKKRIAVVGTGIRAAGMWTKSVAEAYGKYVEFVALCELPACGQNQLLKPMENMLNL